MTALCCAGCGGAMFADVGLNQPYTAPDGTLWHYHCRADRIRTDLAAISTGREVPA